MSESRIPTITGGALRGVTQMSRMSASRLVIGALGLALGVFGVYRLFTQIDNQDLIWLAEWLIAAIILHDFILSPIIVGIGVALSRVPARARRYLQGGLVAGAMITSIGIVLVINVNTGLFAYKFNKPDSSAKQSDTAKKAKALLEQNYAVNLLILLAIVAVVSLGLYGLKIRRDARVADASRGAESSPTGADQPTGSS